VSVSSSLGSADALHAVATRTDGTALTGATTALTLQSRAVETAPWVDVAELSGSLSTVAPPVGELRVAGVLDPADDPATVQVFGRVV
jgi:hypothetical protein